MTQAKCKKYDLNGAELEEIALSYGEETANPQSIKDYIVALRRNARQWSANTKSRSELNHSNAKPHAQKGTGKARQGFLGAPQYKGGGRVHTPKPKFDQFVKINQKERRAAIRHLLIDHLREGNVVFLSDPIDTHFSVPKTKLLANFFEAVGIQKKRILCLGKESEHTISLFNFKKSIRNIPNAFYLLAQNVNGYDLMAGKKIVVMDSAKEEFEALLRGHHE